MSWERKLAEEDRKTMAMLEEMGESGEQLRMEELAYGEARLDREWVAQGRPSPFGWLLGSPYHSGLAGSTLIYLRMAAFILGLTLVAWVVKLIVHWATH
jgi:hypothetical protein